ncbi:MAG: hypothetical protein M1833_006343 [Piccolia ochrophora]|nr:MAG: hypothetical protein M1833_006343 [Piccolia ochrophora]
MSTPLKSLLTNITSPFTSRPSTPSQHTGFTTAPNATSLFPIVDSAVDGEDCLHDCETCTIAYPRKFKIDEDDELYGQVTGWATHMLVATGKTDWVRDVEDEKGSVMEAVGKADVKPSNGTPSSTDPKQRPTTILLLPAFTLVDNVRPADVPDLIGHFINKSATTTTPLNHSHPLPPPAPDLSSAVADLTISSAPTITPAPPPPPPPSHLFSRPCPHTYLILLCSQRTRDARCGQSAPLLRRELERHLRPLGLFRDLNDERPGGVGIYFISHVGGHKYSANMMIYRRGGGASEPKPVVKPTVKPAVKEGTEADAGEEGKRDKSAGMKKAARGAEEFGQGEATQAIWLARVRPEDCEAIVKFTVLQGKVVKPQRQLRGGWDREKGLVSW